VRATASRREESSPSFGRMFLQMRLVHAREGAAFVPRSGRGRLPRQPKRAERLFTLRRRSVGARAFARRCQSAQARRCTPLADGRGNGSRGEAISEGVQL
jgi:hypothetical protein